MVNKPKEKPAVSTPVAESSAAPSTTPAAPAAPSQSASTQATAPATPTPQRTADASAAGSGDSSGLAMGAQRAEAITNMEAMGFEKSHIEAAMRAAFNNPDRAVEYLLNGIPENVQQEQQQRAAPAAPAAPAAGASAQPAPGAQGGDDDGGINLFDLAAQQGGGSAPRVPAAPPSRPATASDAGTHFAALLGEDVDDDVPLPPGAQAISVTEEERDAIERLCRLGFDRDQAIQAYFACDKNEELAANFLFDQPEDDEPPTN
ncbi:hypothetical protein XA68_16562 [Ophiocordyceps unilateralis]|uniref:UV excision repair protein RAD23 n=1 Tax=Ophiocordyceps unilateralis TaxID=268505 RepID=A0A2A9PJY4_OPHUN|nr:hypothetical protein XA68_16562 [Ophiocordyceps unilateralis]